MNSEIPDWLFKGILTSAASTFRIHFSIRFSYSLWDFQTHTYALSNYPPAFVELGEDALVVGVRNQSNLLEL